MRLAFAITAVVAVAVVASCVEHGSRCEVVLLDDQGTTPVRTQRNPNDLTCQATSTPPPCDPTCGPCPATGADIGALPSWGFCGTECEALDQSTCASRSDCRVVRDLGCAVSGTCASDFVGCF